MGRPPKTCHAKINFTLVSVASEGGELTQFCSKGKVPHGIDSE